MACKQWNQLPGDSPTSYPRVTGYSYDNTVDLGATTWRHVAFVERPSRDGIAWLMLSDVCKHCVHAGCLDACPTGAIIRTEFGTVVIQDDVCNGCGYCVPACPFGVPQLDHADGGSHKCTLCYDRLRGGLAPACATACPTGSIRFGPVDELREVGRERVATLKEQGLDEARLYGDDELGGTGGISGLNAMFVLNGPPDAFNLPARPRLPRLNIRPAAAATLVAAAGYRSRRRFRLRASRLTQLVPRSSNGSDPPASSVGYYDVPVIHGPHWKWLVIGYFYFGGISGASAVIAAFLRLYGGRVGCPTGQDRYVRLVPVARPVPHSPHSRSWPAGQILSYAASVPGQLANVDRHLGANGVRGHLGADNRSPTPG